jgi:hypothetical protein
VSHPEIAILGAGPVGLEAALAAVAAGRSFRVFEAGPTVATGVRSWGHVRLFTHWDMNVSDRMRSALEAVGHRVPSGSACPTGTELLEEVLRPIAELPEIAPWLRLNSRVIEIGRDGLLKSDQIGTADRATPPFRLIVRDQDGCERIEFADVVLDCSGTYDQPNALGKGGVRAPGESSAAEHIVRQIPDFEASSVTASPALWAGQRILLVGAGHSAQTAALSLAKIAETDPTTRVTWVIRNLSPTFGAIEDDPLGPREILVRTALSLATAGDTPFDVRLGRSVESVAPTPDGVGVSLGDEETVTVDVILSLTGSVGNDRMYRQLQVHECWATSGPMKLASALLGASSVDCLSQESHGADSLRNPEPNFYIVGSKSYGRNTTFLLRVGWGQVDEVFSLLPEQPVHPDGAA